MQAAGRAGRATREPGMTPAQVFVQTRHPDHPLFDALRRHDYPGFAQAQLLDRQAAGMPPFTHQALLRAEARAMGDALAFLEAARQRGLALSERVTLYPPVPMAMQRVANADRAQMLVESAHRGALQGFLSQWSDALHAERAAHKRITRWAVDIDPLAI